MNVSRLLKMMVWVCAMLTLPAFALANEGSKEKQAGFAIVVVNGRTLTGPNSSARTSGGRIMIPMASVARALGDSIDVSAQNRTITVNRQTRISALFDARMGQVRENGAAILTVSNAGEINFPVNADEMLLPMEIAAAMFDGSFRFDSAKNMVLVSRGQIDAGVVTQSKGRGPVDIYQAEYEYNLSKYFGSLAQSLILNATGRIGDGRFYFNSNSSGSSLSQFTPRNFSLNIERPNGQRFIAGDFGSGSALPLMTANVRGGLVSIPVGRFTVAAFGGRADSGTVLPVSYDEEIPFAPLRSKPRFDTNVFGGYVSSSIADRPDRLAWSAGAMRFSGSTRAGTITSGSVNYTGSGLRMQGDLAFGNFKGLNAESRRVSGSGTAVDLAATYQVAENLSVQGRYANIGKNFLSPQSGVREPIDLKAAGVSWSPVKWLLTTVNASTIKRPGEAGRADSYVTASFGLTPGGGKPRFYISHTQSSSRLVSSGSFTIINATKDFSRWRFFANATRIKNIGPARSNAQFGANITVGDRNSLELSQGIGSGRNLNGMIDWRSSGLFGDRLSFSAGGGYSYSRNGKISPYERVTASLKLPRQSSLQFSYINTTAGPTVLVQLRGTLFRKRESGAYLNAPISEVRNFGSVSGRVFQDLDGNGRYDVGTDKPQMGVKVRIDGNRYVESDSHGMYLFDAVSMGEHKLYLDLLSVRADLTLLDGGAIDLMLNGGRTASYDFRLVRTGRVTGRVWFDANGNGEFDEGEAPLSDVRIVTSSGRDTLTDSDGVFSISDLPPGEHIVLIDEKTLPEKTISGSRSTPVEVFPGRETAEVEMRVIPVPAEVKRFPAKTN